MISRGATIRKTGITEEYSYADWPTDNEQSQVVLLCMITKNGTLQWATEGKELKVIPGCTLLSLTLLKQEADSGS